MMELKIKLVANDTHSNILLTILSNPSVYTVDPTTKQASVLATISGKTSLFAIAELEKDEFYVSAGNFSITAGTLEPGSFALFRVTIACPKGSPLDKDDNRHENDHGEREENVAVEKVVDFPNALLVNGMATLRKEKIVLVPDSYKGAIFVVDVQKKVVTHTIDLPQFHGPTGKVGINGIKIHRGYLYFTVSVPAALYRVRFDEKRAIVEEGAEVAKIAGDPVFMDDFAIDDKDRVWIATNAGNVVVVVDGDKVGQINGTVVAGKKGALDVGGSTAIAFERGKNKDRLYVVTSGGLGGGLDSGVAPEGGKVVALDTRRFVI